MQQHFGLNHQKCKIYCCFSNRSNSKMYQNYQKGMLRLQMIEKKIHIKNNLIQRMHECMNTKITFVSKVHTEVAVAIYMID